MSNFPPKTLITQTLLATDYASLYGPAFIKVTHDKGNVTFEAIDPEKATIIVKEIGMWQPSKLTQKQRRQQQKKQDKANSIACALRNNDICQYCGCYAEYSPGGYGGSLHHIRGKATTELRNDPDNHIWLCFEHHRQIEDQPWKFKEFIEEIER